MTASVIAWRGPSRFDRKTPVVVLLTGFERGSLNKKTGPVVQAHVLVDRAVPAVASRMGLDSAICGTCPRRRTEERGTTCYVSLAKGYPQMGEKLIRGDYAVVTDAPERVRGRFVRVGAYGDPAAVPMAFWRRLLKHASGWTAYTHDWRRSTGLRSIAMASVESPEEAAEARALGWRTFRVRGVSPSGVAEPMLQREVVCPASVEAGRKTTCDRCRLCSGLESRGRDVAIIDHSVKALWARNLGPRRRALPLVGASA